MSDTYVIVRNNLPERQALLLEYLISIGQGREEDRKYKLKHEGAPDRDRLKPFLAATFQNHRLQDREEQAA